MKKIATLALSLLTLSSFASTVSILKKDLIVKAAVIQSTIKCIELDNWSSDPDDVEFKCYSQAALKEASKSLGTILKVEPMNSISREVLNNYVDDAGTYNVKFTVTYY